MSAPSSRTLPSTRAPAMTSCIRFSERSTVDLPQPEGPMKALMLRAGICSVTSCTAWNFA